MSDDDAEDVNILLPCKTCGCDRAIEDFIPVCWKGICEQKLAALVAERDRLRAVVEWIASQKDLFFAECSQAEEIVDRCQKALGEA